MKTMPAEKTVSKASENRRSTKPIMEKRRRARINHSLSELKNLILDALKKDNARHSKLEKADILEMTVKHLQSLQRQPPQTHTPDPASLAKFRAGFAECANEVSRFMGRVEVGAESGLRQRLLNHLANCLTGMEAPPPSLHVQVDHPSQPLLQLVPTRLPTGEVAFLLPLSPASSPISSCPPSPPLHTPTSVIVRPKVEIAAPVSPTPVWRPF